MRYSQMTPEQRTLLLDDPANYPLYVTFLGKSGLLSFEELAFLRRNGVDFDINGAQAAEILAETSAVAPVQVSGGRRPAPDGSRRSRWITYMLVAAIAIMAAFASICRRLRSMAGRL